MPYLGVFFDVLYFTETHLLYLEGVSKCFPFRCVSGIWTWSTPWMSQWEGGVPWGGSRCLEATQVGNGGWRPASLHPTPCAQTLLLVRHTCLALTGFLPWSSRWDSHHLDRHLELRDLAKIQIQKSVFVKISNCLMDRKNTWKIML